MTKTDKITLEQIEARIVGKFFILGNDILQVSGEEYTEEQDDNTSTHTICLVILDNGFTVIGESKPINPEDFKADLGRMYAYNQCIENLWPLD